MKKSVILLLLIISLGVVSAETACELDATLINQDPYPAVPGDYVKIVFQLDGIDSPNCGDITFSLLPEYPIEFNPTETGERTFKKVDYIKDYKSTLLIPYEVRINEDALDGSNPIEVLIQSKSSAPTLKKFNIEIKDVRADFEIYIKDYDYKTNQMTLEILNIKSANVEALSIEIPKQNNIQVKGASRIVVGDLDSNEYTTADFEATPLNGEFKVDIIYSDTINTRRTMEKTISFDSSYFTDRKADEKTISLGIYLLWAIIILLIIYFGYKKIKKKH